MALLKAEIPTRTGLNVVQAVVIVQVYDGTLILCFDGILKCPIVSTAAYRTLTVKLIKT